MSPLHDASSEDHDERLPSYRQRPRPVGVDIIYTLDGDALVVDSTRKTERVLLSGIDQVRFFLKPGKIGAASHVTELHLKDGRTLAIGDTSWRSLMEVERGGRRYIDFVTALCAGIARDNPAARFHAGKTPLLWGIFAFTAALTVVMVAVFCLRAYQQGATGAALIGLGFGALAVMQLWPLVKLNRPARLRTGEVPAALMPKVATTT